MGKLSRHVTSHPGQPVPEKVEQ